MKTTSVKHPLELDVPVDAQRTAPFSAGIALERPLHCSGVHS